MRSITTILIAAAVALAACTGSTSEPGRLLVTGSDGAILTMAPDGTGVEVLRAAGPADVLQPTPDHSGQRIIWNEPDAAVPTVSVWDQTGVVDLPAPFPAFFFAWDARGERFAMLGNDPETGTIGFAIGDREHPPRKESGGAPFFFDWTPTGQIVANVGGNRLFRLDNDGGSDDLGYPPGRFSAPIAAPDGSIIIVTTRFSAGGTAGQGVRVGLAAQASDRADIVRIPGDGGSIEVLKSVVGPVEMDLDSTGQRLAVAEAPTRSHPAAGLTILDLTGDDPVVVTDDFATLLDWNPSGTRLLYATLDEDALALHVWDDGDIRDYQSVSPTALFTRQYLPFWGQYTRSVTLWNPEGSAFVYAARPDGDDRVYVQSIDDDTPHAVREGSFAVWLP